MVFEDPADLIQVLSTERIRVLQAVRTRPIPVSQLASELKRDRQGVMRDVRLLESFGLLKTREAPNPGMDGRESSRHWPPGINWWRISEDVET